MSAEIKSMIKTGVIGRAEPSPSFRSTFFLVPKPNREFCPIFNLKRLNMFLRFNYHQDPHQHQLLQITCLPFGLIPVPRTFASVTNWIAELLRNHGIRCVVYLDDFLRANQSKSALQNDIAGALKMMRTLGWMINFQKSVLAPTQCLEFLGITWDTKRNTKSLSGQKCLTLRNALYLLKQSKWSLRQYQSIMGRLKFASFVTRRGRLHCRTLQYYSRQLPKTHPHRRVSIPQPVQPESEWWLEEIGGSMPIQIPQLTNLLTTNASNTGWGAQLNEISISRTWTKRKQS
ncbi:uncharacterized protein LOC116778731 [Danaus plexippus]|uniref:uncharacterized protein LOC116778731 n=1 Tax=Danaus plexippus TaxID=13037 RepID=UPI002AAF6A3B|nr:uncharacterized protein LOC116778731 [Danaus plexippus]